MKMQINAKVKTGDQEKEYGRRQKGRDLKVCLYGRIIIPSGGGGGETVCHLCVQR